MTTDLTATAKAALDPLRTAMYHDGAAGAREVLSTLAAPDALFQLAFPFETLGGADDFVSGALDVLAAAWPDVERRDTIVMAGPDEAGETWVGCCGYYTGTFARPFLGIPPTGHQAAMRYHEFYRVTDGRIVEMQALWDIPEVMMQAGAWPMGPSLGRQWHAPAPATQDGLRPARRDEETSRRSLEHVIGMLDDMTKHPTDPDPSIMRLEHWWHDKFSWYGPSGIGTGRGVEGFRSWHQIPFLKAMPDRQGGAGDVPSHFFGDGPYVGVTAWPGMSMTLSGDGWLGIVPTGQAITMRSLDFWRVEETPTGLKIRENWVLVDLLSVWDQLGVDVLGRMRELASPRRQF